MANTLTFDSSITSMIKGLDKPTSASSSTRSPYMRASVHVDGFKETLKLLNKILPSLLSYKIANAFSLIGADLLAHSQPRVPYDTGKLRTSGIATIRAGVGGARVVASGNADGTVNANLGLFSSSSLGRVRTFRLDVGYQRTGKDGDDIALWTHEDLFPQDERPETRVKGGPKYAKKLGTGPKYLEMAFIERSSRYLGFLRSVINSEQLGNEIEHGSKVTKRAKGRHAVNVKDPVLSRIQILGYRNIMSAGGDIVQAINSPKPITSYY